MYAPASLNVLLVQADDGLTLGEIIDSLPTDPASLVVLLLVVGFLGFIVYFGIIEAGRGNEEEGGQNETHPPAEEEAAGRPRR